MKTIRVLASIAVVVMLSALVGCANAVNYYHSERLSIATLEVRSSDPQLPVQGNLGLKTRTILVAPGKGNQLSTDPGDATSVVSDFELSREGIGPFGTTTVKSAFITGKAAVNSAVKSSAALSGIDVTRLLAQDQLMIDKIIEIQTDKGLDKAALLTRAGADSPNVLGDETTRNLILKAWNDSDTRFRETMIDDYDSAIPALRKAAADME